MAVSISLASFALQCRDDLAQGRRRIQTRFRDGLPSVQTAAALSDLYDEVICRIWQVSLQRARDEGAKPKHLDQLAFVAHGGLGRGDLSPFSDADLMMLVPRGASAAAALVAKGLVRDLTDSGLEVGFSVRTPAEACSLAWSDALIYTTLTESRLLAGSAAIFHRFFDRFRIGSHRRRFALNDRVVMSRRAERHKWGETNYLLRPNVKRSRGALRDIQLVRWLGFANYGDTQLERLHLRGELSAEDFRILRNAHMFFLRLRHELHFRTGRCQDVLDRPTQMAIAEAWGYRGRTGVLPVEDFMQDYFEHTRGVRYVAAYVGDDTRGRSKAAAFMEYVLSRSVDASIRMGPTHIWVVPSKLQEFSQSLPDVLHLIQLANTHRRRISHTTWQAIRQVMMERPAAPPDADSVASFLEFLSHPGRLAALLRRLHELRILEQLIPAMKRCRGLLQFNAYHKYTVDVHCIRAVEAAADFENSTSAMGRRYRRIKDKTLLHLALLIHDLGKGYEEDHSEVGRRIAGEVADAFGLDATMKETLQWLIHKHLLINEVAFRHDLNDPHVVLKFAAEVGSIGRLELLLVHTVADLTAVGPDVINDWKTNLIEDLYRRTRRYFETGNLPGENDPEVASTRATIVDSLRRRGESQSIIDLVDQLPLSVLRLEGGELADELSTAGRWLSENPGCWCIARFDPSGVAVRYTIVSRQGRRTIGAFARITGALNACGLWIMRANIETVGEDLLWDDFWVKDPEFPGQPPAHRTNAVCESVRKALDDFEWPLPKIKKKWKTQPDNEPESVNILPTKVLFDNDTFESQTILSLFTYDSPGLLYRVALALAQTNVSIQFAKIDTHLDQIADVFYVTEADGNPILDSGRQDQIRAAIFSAIKRQA